MNRNTLPSNLTAWVNRAVTPQSEPPFCPIWSLSVNQTTCVQATTNDQTKQNLVLCNSTVLFQFFNQDRSVFQQVYCGSLRYVKGVRDIIKGGKTVYLMPISGKSLQIVHNSWKNLHGLGTSLSCLLALLSSCVCVDVSCSVFITDYCCPSGSCLSWGFQNEYSHIKHMTHTHTHPQTTVYMLDNYTSCLDSIFSKHQISKPYINWPSFVV